jgi:hypothetical protein
MQHIHLSCHGVRVLWDYLCLAAACCSAGISPSFLREILLVGTGRLCPHFSDIVRGVYSMSLVATLGLVQRSEVSQKPWVPTSSYWLRQFTFLPALYSLWLWEFSNLISQNN